MGPDPAVAAVRVAVRRALGELPAGMPVLVACSGGADSLALAAATAFEAPRAGRRAGGVTVDHRLQEGSGHVAQTVVRAMRELGLDPAESVAVTVTGPGGPENAARRARYAALDEAARRAGAAVLLGHTLDDQAETVLLGLARGSGARSLAGMPPRFQRGEICYMRPLLGLERATTRRACRAMGLTPWDDPHNEDPAYTRVRLRREVMPALEKALGPGVAAALARTARLLRDDAEALDALAERARSEVTGDDGALDAAALGELPRAVRTRVLRGAAVEAGSPAGTLAAVHVEELDRLITDWRGQRHVDLPGGVRALRRYGKLLFRRGEIAADGRGR
ncbi:tRNA lysidine(34) synthetase TilS [Thermomonospora curvata]|uniref:tRNA(Ile)-lysidine synthase n=1 Tax=Thermomonospora curvata (strain ATCC 19995 / DSM 43183 / JCM 3096 / KCTC 9072 / NBRC 15933 / NCIMB 10081 / Henssen B9) TaxID=471852 RepID=D1A549_THECD|nr:tRNA lysidine(34) synthetase TilS [Thermomonospora curvata]ACZ00035.1 tRNA(Ile)-lysidine synthetase [Thermomonospora curvata DSM 43183]